MLHVSISEFIRDAHANPNNDIVIRETCRVSGMSRVFVLNCTPEVVVPGTGRREIALRALVTVAEARESSPFPRTLVLDRRAFGAFVSIRSAWPKAPPISISAISRHYAENRRNPAAKVIPGRSVRRDVHPCARCNNAICNNKETIMTHRAFCGRAI